MGLQGSVGEEDQRLDNALLPGFAWYFSFSSFLCDRIANTKLVEFSLLKWFGYWLFFFLSDKGACVRLVGAWEEFQNDYSSSLFSWLIDTQPLSSC